MYDIYSILEHHYFEIEKRTNEKFVVIQYYETLKTYLPLPNGTRAGLKKCYPNSRGVWVKSTILVNTMKDVSSVRKILSVHDIPIRPKILMADYGPSRHRGSKVKVVDKPVFVTPYPQKALDGVNGLTSADLARSLGVKHKHVTEKIKRITLDKLISLGFKAASTAKGFELSTETAKFFVAKWDNDLGWGYLRYLLSCENIVEHSPSVGTALSENLMGGLSETAIAQIATITSTILEKIIPAKIESAVMTFTPKIEYNSVRHEEAMLSASQQAICQPLFSMLNAKHGCSIIHSLIKKAAKLKFRPDAPASDCTWHKIRQSDFEELVDFIKNYELSDLDEKRVEKFLATPAGKRDKSLWVRKKGNHELLHSNKDR